MERTLKIGSVSRTTRARRALSSIGIRTQMRRINAAASADGCAWGLTMAEEALFPATQELLRLGIAYEIL